jgi:hypothetical protein
MSDTALVIDLDQPEGTPAAAPPPPAEDEYGAPVAAEPRRSPEEGIDELARQKADFEAKLAAERSAREAAEARAQESGQVAQQSTQRAMNADLQQVLAAKEVLERDAKQTRDNYRYAMEQGDFDAAAQAQEAMANLAIQRTRLNSAESTIKHRIDNPPAAQQRQVRPAEPADPIKDPEGYLAGLTKPTADWLRQHPEYFQDPRKNTKAYAAHLEAVADDIKPDTPEYFRFVEQRLGIGGQSKALARVQDPAPVPVSAPVSRGNSSSSSTLPNRSGQVTLTAEQVQMAKDLDMTPREYALHLYPKSN